MKIAIIGALDGPISKNSLGGTEMWTYELAEALIKKGHKVTLFASSESEFSGTLVSACRKEEVRTPAGDLSKPNYIAISIEEAIAAKKLEADFDLFHLSVFNYYCYLPLLENFKKPVVATIHGYNRMEREEASVMLNRYKKPYYVFVSESFAKNWPKPKKGRVIYNGVDLEKYQLGEDSREHYLWIGRIAEEKGILDAITFAERTGEKTIIAGPIGDQRFFDDKVKPRIKGHIDYVGPVKYEQKLLLYQKAKALLFPIKLREPMPLVVLEALAAGAPILSYKIDPMADIIVDGYNGFLYNDIKEMIELYKNSEIVDNNNCRETIIKKFDLKDMVLNYLELYQAISKKD